MLVLMVLGFNFEDEGQRFWVEPGRRKDICAALAFEKESQPEGKRSASRRQERLNGALIHYVRFV